MLAKSENRYNLDNDAIYMITIGAFKLTRKWLKNTVADFGLTMSKDVIDYIMSLPIIDEIKAIIFLSIAEFILRETQITKITKKYTENVYRGIKNTILGKDIKGIVKSTQVERKLLEDIRRDVRNEIYKNDKILKDVKDKADQLEEEYDNMVNDPEVIEKVLKKRAKDFNVSEITRITGYPLGVVRRIIRINEGKSEFTEKEKEERNKKENEEDKREGLADKAEDFAQDLVKGQIKEEIKKGVKKIISNPEEVIEIIEEVGPEASQEAIEVVEVAGPEIIEVAEVAAVVGAPIGI